MADNNEPRGNNGSVTITEDSVKLISSVLGGLLVLMMAAVGHAIIRTHTNQTRIDNLTEQVKGAASQQQIEGIHRRLNRMDDNLEYIRQYIVGEENLSRQSSQPDQ